MERGVGGEGVVGGGRGSRGRRGSLQALKVNCKRSSIHKE